MFNFQSLFSEEPEKEWNSGLGAEGGEWRIKPTSFDDDGADSRFPAFQQAWRNGAGIDEMFGEQPFKLHGSVGGSGVDNHRPDVAKVETFLDKAGYYKPMDEDGPTGWHSSNLDRSIRKFQKDQGLEVDGVLQPDGPTIKSLENKVSKQNATRLPNFSPVLSAQAETGTMTDSSPSTSNGTELAYMTMEDMLYPQRRALEGTLPRGHGKGMSGGAIGGAAIGGSLLDAATKGPPPSLPAEALPPLPGHEPHDAPQSTKTELIPPLIKVDAYGTPVADPERPNIFVFPAQPQAPQADVMEQRRERPETKAQIDTVRDDILKAHPEWSHVAGGRIQGSDQEKSEFRVPGPGKNLPEQGEGDGRPRSGYTDLTFKTKDGHFVHVQTVDVDPRTGHPSSRELDNAERIHRLLQRDQQARHDVYLIPKSRPIPPQR